jgi:hypothetical protein
MGIKYTLLKATKKSFEGDLAKHEANLEVYLENSAGVGEHSDIIGEIKGLVEKIDDARGCIEVVKVRMNSSDLNGYPTE